jgi:hypothetical protein
LFNINVDLNTGVRLDVNVGWEIPFIDHKSGRIEVGAPEGVFVYVLDLFDVVRELVERPRYRFKDGF